MSTLLHSITDQQIQVRKHDHFTNPTSSVLNRSCKNQQQNHTTWVPMIFSSLLMTILKLCISLAAVFFFQIHHFLLSSAIFVHKFQAKQHTLCHLLIHSVWFCENFRWKISRLSNLYHNNLYPRRPHKFTSLPTLIINLATYRVFFFPDDHWLLKI